MSDCSCVPSHPGCILCWRARIRELVEFLSSPPPPRLYQFWKVDWTQQTDEWQEAAARARDAWPEEGDRE